MNKSVGEWNNASVTIESISEPYKELFDDAAIAITAGLLIPMALFGIFANVVTILVVYKAPKLRSIFNYYIMSLCVSDLISAVISPLALYRRIWGLKYWSISTVLCKIYWGGDNATSITTSYHILAFSALRLLSVALPHVFSRITLKHAKISIILIWILSMGAGFIPFALFMGSIAINRNDKAMNRAWPSCSLKLEWLKEYLSYSKYGNITMFYIPFGMIFIQSAATSILIYYRRIQRMKVYSCRPADSTREKTEANRQKKENHAIVQLALIVGSFAIGYLPNTIFLVVSPLMKPKTHHEKVVFWWFGTIVYICLRFSKCLNPIFYNLASSKLRSETMKLLKRSCWRDNGNLPGIRKSVSFYTAT